MLPLPAVPRVAVFRALQLGDLLCAIPALRALRGAWPAARIELVSLPWAADLRDRYPEIVDEVIPFPGWPGLPEREPDIAAIPSFVAEMQARRFDLAIQAHGDGRITDEIVRAFRARQMVGFTSTANPRPDCLPYPNTGHEIERLLALASFAGAPSLGPGFTFPVTHSDRANRDAAWPDRNAPHRYAVVHAGSRAADRRWSASGFAAVADRLADLGFPPVLTGAPAEVDLAGEVADRMTAPAVNLAGRTTLGGLAALLEGAALIVTNDTGVSHVAAGLRVPSVVLFTGSDPARWAPLDAQPHRPVIVAGRPDGLVIAEVIAQAQSLLLAGAVDAHA